MNLTLEVTHPAKVLLSSDFSQQEPKLSATVSQDAVLVNAFRNGRDAYATLASIALGVPYEECLEFKLDENGKKTSEVNPEGKERRSLGKVLNLGGLSSYAPLAEALLVDC